ncbi:hypothetical protein A3Q56_06647, partial [Intoshia linei]
MDTNYFFATFKSRTLSSTSTDVGSKITSTRSTPKLDFIDSTIDKSKTNKYEANGLEITPESITYQDYLASSLSTPFSIVNNDKVNFNVVYNEKSQEWCKFFEEMTGYIYGWRCFSNLMRGISIPNESVSQYNKDCRDIMKDSIDKLKYYYAQQKSFVYYFIHTIISYHNNNDPMIMTPSVLQATIFMMGSFGMTDEMVRIKNSIKNDFSYYNKINEADMEMRHDQSLAIFLATPYSVRTNLIRSLIVKKDGYSNFFITVIEYILNTLDSDVEIFMASDVKYYLTSLLICLDIVLNEFSVGKLSKKINMQSIQKIYIKYPLVHVIGDQYFDYRMELRLLSDKKKKKINFIKLKIENDKLPLNYIYFIKDEIIKGSNYLIDKYVLFKLIMNDRFSNVYNEYMKIGTAETKKYLHFVSQLHIECLRFMNFWNENINLFYIGKLNKPALKHSDSKFDEEYENDIYASAIMKNVSSEEYNSLISCILYMKKFQQYLFDVNKNMVDLIKKFYYYVCKDFFSSLATKNTESNKAGFPTLVNVIKESFPFFFTNDDRSPIYLHYEENAKNALNDSLTNQIYIDNTPVNVKLYLSDYKTNHIQLNQNKYHYVMINGIKFLLDTGAAVNCINISIYKHSNLNEMIKSNMSLKGPDGSHLHCYGSINMKLYYGNNHVFYITNTDNIIGLNFGKLLGLVILNQPPASIKSKSHDTQPISIIERDELITSELPNIHNNLFVELVKKYAFIFPNTPGRTKLINHNIKTTA